jgi:murein hydrolase activator
MPRWAKQSGPGGNRTLRLGILLLAISLLMGANRAWPDELGTVLVSKLNVRAGPGRQFPVLTQLSKGAQVRIAGRENGWLKINQEGSTGYILDQGALVQVAMTAAAPDPASLPGLPELKEAGLAAEDVRKQFEASKAELAATEHREREVIKSLNAAQEELDLARKQVREAEAALAELRTEIERIEQDCADLAKEIDVNEAYASQRLVALYKLNWVGRIEVLATAESFFDVVSRQAALSRILNHDEALLEKLHKEQRTQEILLEQLNARQSEKRSLELTLTARIAQLKTEHDRRGTLLEKVRTQKSLAHLAMLDLQTAAHQLDSALQLLQTAPENKAQTAFAAAASPFDAYKGLLNWPVKGKILTFFGPSRDEKYNVTHFKSGINIQAERGEPIRAVSNGYTVFANWFKGFGNMLIIDHGDHYYTVYAHLEEIFKDRGDQVEKDEVIATVGDSGSLVGPALHFEVRHHGKPMDPLQWIKKG